MTAPMASRHSKASGDTSFQLALFQTKDGKTCTRCHQSKPASEFYIMKYRNPVGELNPACKPCARKKRKDYSNNNREKIIQQRVTFKLECLNAYGGARCSCCGETEIKFLTIDHIDGGGAKHRKKIRQQFYHWLKRNNFPPGFRVLCFNCNCGRESNDGICPHKTKPPNENQNFCIVLPGPAGDFSLYIT
jgi:hypothetical protein